MRRQILTGVVLTITSCLAIPVALGSVSAPAGGSPPVSLADLASTSVSGTETSSTAIGCSQFAQEFDASYAGSPNVGSVSLHIVGCVDSASPDLVFSGWFTITTNVGTLSGTASGPITFPNPLHTVLRFQLTLSVQSGTGSFAGTTGNLQFEANEGTLQPNPGGFSGNVSVPAPTTAVGRPSNGATVSGSTILDAGATNATSVEFLLFGGPYGYAAPVVCTATPTYYGWLCSWNTATVPNGSYVLVSEASGAGGSAFSSGVRITVSNPPTTSVLFPSSGATLSKLTTLDASSSNATSVEFLLFGGIYGYSAPVLCTATPTYYGWLCSWNTATVPNGSYILVAEASNSTSTAFSPNVNITINN